MKYTASIVIFMSSIIGTTLAQGSMYYTRNANLQVHGEYQGESFHGRSIQLGITIDYEAAEILINLNLNALTFDVDTLNTIVQATPQEIDFKGTLSLEHIDTDDHPPLKFTMEGWVNIDDELTKIKGHGELRHIDQSDDLACMLGLVMVLNLNDFGVEIPGLENGVELVIKQALLKNDKY